MTRRRRLFAKYVIVFVGLVTGALLVSGLLELYFSFGENKDALVRLAREKAAGAAARIEDFVKEIERQIGWTSHPPLMGAGSPLDQRRIDFLRLLRQVPAITEVSYLDAGGREQLRISRLAVDVVGGGADFSADPRFLEPKSGRPHFGAVYFRKGSEPYMTIALRQSGGGVTAAEVNLKFIWDVVSQIKVGKAGLAFVVDGRGDLIAHPDISLVLQKRSLAGADQVRAALAERAAPGGAGEVMIARDLAGRRVLTAHSVIAPLGWVVFVEQPLEEAFEPVRAAATRTLALLVVGVALSVGASLILARRMVHPIRAIEAGAATIGSGDLAHRIDVKTGDELEALAEQFNRMTAQLADSYATLEQRVLDRTRELREALEQQTATSEILRAISSSPTDVGPVFEAIVTRSAELCKADYAGVMLVDGDVLRSPLGGYRGLNMTAAQSAAMEAIGAIPISEDMAAGRAILHRRVVHVHDVLAEPPHPLREAVRRVLGYRTFLAVPLVREEAAMGVIVVWRTEMRPFTDKQIALVQTFADQAVIAIENVRLFTELQEKNRAVTEALEQQTATADVLRVISSSPTDLGPVYRTILANVIRLCEANIVALFLHEGDVLTTAAHQNATPEFADYLMRGPRRPGRETTTRLAALERRTVHVGDLLSDASFAPSPRDLYERENVRTVLSVPMLRESTLVGVITTWRREVRPFSDVQIALVQTFADQAVIAIENVRLFTELQEKNRAVSEALEQQTATSDILRVISSSPTDIQPVFRTILEKALTLCGAQSAFFWRYEGGEMFRAMEFHGVPDDVIAWLGAQPYRFGPPFFKATGPWHPGQITDLRTTEAYRQRDPVWVRTVEDAGARTLLNVPLVREHRLLGTISVYRNEVRPFSERQVELLRTFADQAVIAIENVRLFAELQERTRQLTRSVEQLTALGEVSRAVTSTLDLDAVLDTIVSRAAPLAGADGCSIYEYDDEGETFRVRATSQVGEELLESLRATGVRRSEGAVGRLADTLEPVQIPDILAEGAYESRLRDALVRFGYRALLAVPLLLEGRIMGGLVVSRKAAGEFPVETVELLKTFATQSGLAIQNARLFREIEEKSQQLEVANRHKSEFLASMSHELRTPLNAVIGFSEVLVERMFGELNEKQEEYLKDIHSSGRHLLSLINDILDLAKIEAGRMELEVTSFDLPQAIDNALTLVRGRADAHAIRLQAAVDPRLGDFNGDERKFKQILLNLLSNAVKFTPDGGAITVDARLVDGAVEVAVTDSGIGIAPEDQQAVFEEFRQVGTDYARKREGTGLGLALTRRFVELHGGRIGVESTPGRGSTFTFSLPVRSWPTS